MATIRVVLIACLTASATLILTGATATKPPGSAACREADRTDFSPDDRLVLSYLYYWYQEKDREEPALAIHPPANRPFDWRNPAWHRQQLQDMSSAGVDVALAVYWGTEPAWSEHGLDELVAARDSLLARGRRAPAIGLFLDTNLYAELLRERPVEDLADLTTDRGLGTFIEQIASFFDRVPACDWARLGGQPIIFLWRPDTEEGSSLRFDDRTTAALYARLEERLGVRPYIVRERTWDERAAALGTSFQTDDVFAWGGALTGPLFAGRTVSLGPGYDDRLVPDRVGYTRDRENGALFTRDLRAASLSGASWLLLETWNEQWEATAIADSAEYGRSYIELSRRYTQFFHQLGGETVRDAWIDVGTGESNYLRWLTAAAEELGVSTQLGGRPAVRPLIEPTEGVGYLHFAVPEALRGGPRLARIDVEYFDQGGGAFQLEYDRSGIAASEDEIYAPAEQVPVGSTGQWKIHRFELADAAFQGQQYDRSGDFRLRDEPAPGEEAHAFGRILLREGPADRPVLLGPANAEILAPGSSSALDLRWIGVGGASSYLVQLRPFGVVEAPDLRGTGERVKQCGSAVWTGQASLQAVTTATICSLKRSSLSLRGLYRWRVLAVDQHGAPVGDPSDWWFLLVD
ncbi:MAG: DUF5010 domain-containing protein [Chloroflexi bacterium]|nr:DUF5010 domain-containing protein [Chloroflexota bacterium]